MVVCVYLAASIGCSQPSCPQGSTNGYFISSLISVAVCVVTVSSPPPSVTSPMPVPTPLTGMTSSGFEKSHGSLNVSVAKSPDVDRTAGGDKLGARST